MLGCHASVLVDDVCWRTVCRRKYKDRAINARLRRCQPRLAAVSRLPISNAQFAGTSVGQGSTSLDPHRHTSSTPCSAIDALRSSAIPTPQQQKGARWPSSVCPPHVCSRSDRTGTCPGTSLPLPRESPRPHRRRGQISVVRRAGRRHNSGFKVIAPQRPTMIAMTFTGESDTRVHLLLQSALPLASDRSRDKGSLSWAAQAIVRPASAPAWRARKRIRSERCRRDWPGLALNARSVPETGPVSFGG